MGKVMTHLKLTNDADAQYAQRGLIQPSEVRRATVEALVDTGATMLVLPEDLVAALGLPHRPNPRRTKLADGTVIAIPWVGGVLIEILGREMTCDALVMPAGSTPLIGQIPLEAFHLIIDPKTGDLAFDPENPEGIDEILAVA